MRKWWNHVLSPGSGSSSRFRVKDAFFVFSFTCWCCCMSTVEWTKGVPKEPGHYWAWAADGDMMDVFIEVEPEDNLIRVKNSADSPIGAILLDPQHPLQWPWTTSEAFAVVFSHFTPYTDQKPAPPLPLRLTIHFDGGCEPNPKGWGTYGWTITDTATGREIIFNKGVACKPTDRFSTNNHAEYCALGFALRWLWDWKWRGEELLIFGDSQLVINQINDVWNINNDHLAELCLRVWTLLSEMQLLDFTGKTPNKFKCTWVPREQNARCDALTSEAYTEATGLPMPDPNRWKKYKKRKK